jgi:hypothetical protein
VYPLRVYRHDTLNIQSSSSFHSYNTTAYGPRPGGGGNGILCSGNCDTSNGYSQSFKFPGFTGQLGVSVNYTLIGLNGTAFAGLLFDSHGHTGIYMGGGGGVAVGAAASGGIQAGFSNGNSICAMGGPFTNYSGTFGAEASGTADYFEGGGDAPGGTVSGGGLTGGVGGGCAASASYTVTTIHPFGAYSCVGGKIQ